MKSFVLILSVLFAAFGLRGRALHAQEIVARAPGPDATPHEVCSHIAKSGLRYTWTVPPGYDGQRKVQLTVILHGTGLDYRWGHANHDPRTFRPADVVVSVDGTSPGPNESRLFLGEPKDATAFHEFLLELRESFAIDRVFLYGHSQGGFFVTYFAGRYPEDVAGVCAHASGMWNWTEVGKKQGPIAYGFLHGTRDPVVPYAQSEGAVGVLRERKQPLVQLRRIGFYNHWPNGVRADEVLSWCEGMTTLSAERALELAERLLTPKSPDEYQFTAPIWFAGANDVLRRLLAKDSAFADEPSETVRARARRRQGALERHVAEHVSALREHVANKKALVLREGNDWLGHLVALREDARGLEPLENYVKALGYDALAKNHSARLGKALGAYYGDDEKAALLETIAAMPAAFLVESWPANLVERIEPWRSRAKIWKLGKKESAGIDLLEVWSKAWIDGAAGYKRVWSQWRLD